MRYLLPIVVLLASSTLAPGKTITLTDEDCEYVAVISASAPRMSWAASEEQPGVWTARHSIDFTAGTSFLIRYPIERIPKGQRITQAEWFIPVQKVLSKGKKVVVRRLTTEWGAGVCYEYRLTSPKKEPWAKPGATGGSDRAVKATATLKTEEPGEITVNVTEDVDLWYSGTAKNHGWILNQEDEKAHYLFPSPLCDSPRGHGRWKLRITYEPAD